MNGHYDSYEPRATIPAVGSTWICEPNNARTQVVVEEVRWDGEEWWIKTSGYWNDLGRFWETCVPEPDPNTIKIGEVICWHGRPSFAKAIPSGWPGAQAAAKMRWAKVGIDSWKRMT